LVALVVDGVNSGADFVGREFAQVFGSGRRMLSMSVGVFFDR